MGVDAIAALLFGRLFDRVGFSVLIVSIPLSSLFAPLVFMGGFHWALVGMGLWGVGMGAQESIMRAAIADLVPTNRLGFAFGLFNTGYGLFWFVGSALMGIFYDLSVNTLVAFSVGVQLLSIPLLLVTRKEVIH
jgi:MFS family permease